MFPETTDRTRKPAPPAVTVFADSPAANKRSFAVAVIRDALIAAELPVAAAAASTGAV